MYAHIQKMIEAKQKVPSYVYRNAWRQILPSSLHYQNVVFLCIGTNRCTGDAYAPLVGTYLKDRGYRNVLGTIDQPVHHLNLQETIEQIPSDKTIIALDAALGRINHVGYLFLEEGPISPGSGVGKNIPPVGNYHIKGIVNINAGMQNQLLLMSTQLDLVMEMAKQTAFLLGWLFPKRGLISP
jgi:putative sporulation protein YyaC